MLLTFTAILAVFISLSNGIPVQNGPLPGYDPNDSFCEEKSSGNYEYPAPHCDFFYSCSNSLTYVMACGEGGLYYDKRTNKCEWPWKFPQWKQDECEGKLTGDNAAVELQANLETPVPGYDPNNSFCEDKRNGNYEYPAPHCDFFYSCSNSLTYVMACGEGGLYYDKRTNRCEWPWKFPQWKRDECEGQVYQTGEEKKDDASSGVIFSSKNDNGPLPGYDPNDKFCWGKPNGNYEYPAPHCEFFYSCYDSHTYVMVCAERYLYYDRKTNACDYPWRFPQWKQDECKGKHLSTENISTTTTTIPTTTEALGELTTEAELETSEAFGKITTEAEEVETTEDM